MIPRAAPCASDGPPNGRRATDAVDPPLFGVRALASFLRSRWTLAAAVAAVALCGAFGWRHFYGVDAGTAGRGKADSAQAPAPIPVTIAQVKKADFPVYLNGLGAVEPYQTVLIRSRVDGAGRQDRLQTGPDGQARRHSRADRSASLSGGARPGAGEEDAGRGDAQETRSSTCSATPTSPKKDSVALQQLDTQQATVDQLTAQIKGDQAIIDNAQTQFDYTTIRSPLTGKTGFRLVDAGNIVHAVDTTGIVTIVQLQPISVVFTAPEEDVPQINKALAAGVTPVTALSSDGLRTLSQGHLSVVNAAIDPTSGSIGMKATFENADGALWPGLSVSTRLLVDTLKQVTVVPDGAVQRGPNGLYAFVVGGDNKVETRADHGRSGRRRPIGRPDGFDRRRDRGHGRPVPIGSRFSGPAERGEFRHAAADRARRARPQRRPDMAGGISEPFIRHPVATSLLMVGILFVGIIAYPRLPVAPLPQVDFPTIQVSAKFPGAGPDTMASAIAQPLEIAIRADLRRLADDVDEHAWLDRHHHPIRPRSRHRRGRGRRPGGDQRRQRTTAEKSPEPADLSQGQSGGFSHSPARRDLGTPAADRSRRQCRDQARPADQSGRRRRPGERRRPAEARHPHPTRSRQARRQGVVARGCAHAALGDDARRAQGRDQRRGELLHDLHQRSARPVGGLE